MAILGNNIIVYNGGTAFAATRTDEIQTGAEMIEIASSATGAWRSYLVGRKEWSFTTGFFVTQVQSLLNVGSTYNITIGDRTDRYNRVSGTAILETCQITATMGNLVTGSFKFRGTGALT